MGKTTQTVPCHCPAIRSDHHTKQLTECSHVKPVNLILIHLIKNKFHYNEITICWAISYYETHTSIMRHLFSVILNNFDKCIHQVCSFYTVLKCIWSHTTSQKCHTVPISHLAVDTMPHEGQMASSPFHPHHLFYCTHLWFDIL